MIHTRVYLSSLFARLYINTGRQSIDENKSILDFEGQEKTKLIYPMDRQEFFQSYMDHWGLADVLLDCYVDLYTMKTPDANSRARLIAFKQLLAEHHISCREEQIFRDEIRELEDGVQRLKQ